VQPHEVLSNWPFLQNDLFAGAASQTEFKVTVSAAIKEAKKMILILSFIN